MYDIRSDSKTINVNFASQSNSSRIFECIEISDDLFIFADSMFCDHISYNLFDSYSSNDCGIDFNISITNSNQICFNYSSIDISLYQCLYQIHCDIVCHSALFASPDYYFEKNWIFSMSYSSSNINAFSRNKSGGTYNHDLYYTRHDMYPIAFYIILSWIGNVCLLCFYKQSTTAPTTTSGSSAIFGTMPPISENDDSDDNDDNRLISI